MEKKYQDIINKPHHVSQRHPQMSMAKRAAQFHPVTMTQAEFPDAPTIQEYWSWINDQTSVWCD